MLRRLQNAVVVALSVCALVGFGFGIWQASHAPQSPSQRAAAKYENKTAAKTVEERHQAAEEAIATYTLWLMAFTGILAVATAGLGALNFFQVRLARSEFLSTHRPKVRVKHLWLASDIWQGEKILVNLTLVNNGTAEGVFNEAGWKFVVVRNDRSLPPEPHITGIIKGPGKIPRGYNLYFKDIGDGTVLASHDNVEIQNGRSKLYCIGYVSYLDSLKNIRITGFCRVLTFPPNTLALRDNCRFRALDPIDPDYEYED